MAIQIEIKGLDRLIQVLDEAIVRFEKEATEGLNAIAYKLESNMRHKVPVRTGALRDSITVEERGRLEALISLLYYGFFVEYGTSKMAAKPFIRPSFEAIKNDVSNLVWKHVGKLFHK